MLTGDIFHILLAASWNGKMCFPFFTVWYTKCLCGISSLELAVCSPALFHFKFWAQWVRKQGAFFPFCSWNSPLCTAVLSDAELDSHPWHYSCSAKDDLSCKWGRKWEVISVCSSKLSFQELCPKGIFMAGNTEADGCVAFCSCKSDSLYFSHLMCLLTL